MKLARLLIILAAGTAIGLSGCYTKFYRPGMEQAGAGPYDTIYNRYDSTAIDTTLTAEDWQSSDQTYPTYYDNWYYWGRPRGYTRWGFDFYNFSPDYYSSYYGYYDYYGVPWWQSWGYYPGYPGYSGGGVSEPPSKRHGRRGESNSGGGGSVAAPPAQNPSSPSYVQPQTGSSSPPPQSKPAEKKSDDPQKRGGRKGG